MRLACALIPFFLVLMACTSSRERSSEAAEGTSTQLTLSDAGAVGTEAAQVQRESSIGDGFDRERALLEEAESALENSDYAVARASTAEAVAALLARPEEEQGESWLALLDNAGQAAWDAQDVLTARAARERVLEGRLAAFPDDHPDLQKARLNLANTMFALGDLAAARALQEKALEVFSRTLPDDHSDLQSTRLNLAATKGVLGDFAGARALLAKVLDVFSRSLPDDHPDLQLARQNLAATQYMLGDVAGARALFERVLEVRSRTLPDDHPDLQAARGNLALMMFTLGDLTAARALQEKVLEVNSRILPDDHPELQKARGNLASTQYTLGDLVGARALEEEMLDAFSRVLPDDHPDLQAARLNVAATIKTLGDLAAARALEEKVLEICSRTLPDDHPGLQMARGNLALTIQELGDLAAARALQEKVLDVNSRTLPDDHPELQKARGNLAGTLRDLGDLASARALEEKVLEVYSRTLPDDHPDVQAVLQNLAATIKALGDLAAARMLEEKVLEVYSRTLPDDHPDLQVARGNLVWIVAEQVASLASVAVFEEEQEREEVRERERCSELITALCRGQTSAARAALLTSPPREAEARCARISASLDTCFSFAGGLGAIAPFPELERPSLVLSETTRGAALCSAAMMRAASGSPRSRELHEELKARSEELATLAQGGTTTEEFLQAVARREAIERELLALARELSGGAAPVVELDVEALAAQLAERDAVVAYRRYRRTTLEVPGGSTSAERAAPVERRVDSLCAFVVRAEGADSHGNTDSALLTRVEFGSIEPIEAAVRAWREAIGTGLGRGVGVSSVPRDGTRERGEELRALIFDPLRQALGDADRLILVLDDVLQLVPIEALPLGDASSGNGDGAALLGDRWRMEKRCTLTELLAPNPRRVGAEVAVALGGASFDSKPLEPGAEDLAPIEDSQPTDSPAAAILRGGAWERGFAPLTHTGLEARDIAALFEEVHGAATSDTQAIVLEKRKASRASLEALGPRAKWLHVATHGWFAPESIKSWKDPEPLDEHSGLGLRLSGEEQIRGMSPMLLCGLALAGANLPENELGRAPGLVTAEELAALDLSRCELAVLSACDTNVGERRAGQGVASLQRALQMAGARSVITSLWKVPDEATRELMTDFYRRIWVEKKPKWQALWEAKMRIRGTKDAEGAVKYDISDWAAWVLTGEPD